MLGKMEWLKRLIRRLLGKKEPEVGDVGQVLRRQYQEERAKRRHQIHGEMDPIKEAELFRHGPRSGIRSTDLGIRKLKRHRGGRQYDQRSGFDPNKRMEDIKDGDTRPPKKKGRGWAEDRHRQK